MARESGGIGKGVIMAGKLKALGMALVGVFAILAAAAPAASAEPLFHSEQSHTIFTGEALSVHKFSFNGVTIECPVVSLQGTASSSTAKELPLEAKFENCTAAGTAVLIDMNGCIPIPKLKFTGIDLYIWCSTGKQIEITTKACTYDVPTQTIAGLSYSEILEPAKAIEVLWLTAGIRYKQTGFLCSGGSGEFENGSWTGKSVLEGETTTGEALDIWIE